MKQTDLPLKSEVIEVPKLKMKMINGKLKVVHYLNLSTSAHQSSALNPFGDCFADALGGTCI